MASSPPPSIKEAKSPWLNIPVSTYMLPFISSPPLSDHAYAPLEAASSFASPESSGDFKGGLGMVQIVRYQGGPVGAYDELLVVPGYFSVPGTMGRRGKEKEMLRITRIYVSQKDTCWNGRKNWNIPKHLANFAFTSGPDSLTVEVFQPGIKSKPFFKVNLAPFQYTLAIPFSTNLSKYVGMDLRLAQPPLPAARHAAISGVSPDVIPAEVGENPEHLCGTDEWRVSLPEIWGKAKGCWVECASLPSKANETSEQSRLLDEIDSGSEAAKNIWWPTYKPWKAGLWMENGKLNFSENHVQGVGNYSGG